MVFLIPKSDETDIYKTQKLFIKVRNNENIL